MDLKASIKNKNKLILDHEDGFFQKMKSDTRNTIFEVLFILLKEHEVSIYTSLILAAIQLLHLIVFAFHPTIASVWQETDITDVIYRILSYFNVVTYFKETNWNLYITFFYIGLGLVTLSHIGFLYIVFVLLKKKASFSWCVLVLRNIMLLFTTILFLPFVEYFVSILACVKDTTGTSVHSYFSQVKCWEGTHIAHGIFAIIGCVLFLPSTLLISLTFYEYKCGKTNDATARVSSRPNFILNLYQMIMIVCLTFLTGEEFQVILLALILMGSILLFVKFFFNSSYHDEITSKIWAIISALNLWTASMIVFTRILENTLFVGCVIAWILGIPFVILIVLTSKDQRIHLLLINTNKFQDGSQITNQVRYLLKLLQWQSTNKNAEILLDGYIEIHKQICNHEDCPLKQSMSKNSRFTKSLMNQDESLNEKYAVLIQLIYKIYHQGIKKFPNDYSLRISYAFFLLERMQSKQQALQELTQAEQSNPSFDNHFIIFRYKKIIEDEISEIQNENQENLDIVTEVSFQNHLRQLQANIEKSALLHMEFWSHLSEDSPDLAKLSDTGSKINASSEHVEDSWKRLVKINPNNAKAMRLYGKYLVEIINDKESGDNLLEKARSITNVHNNRKMANIISGLSEDLNNEATPSMWVSGEQDKFGVISGVNLAAASLFGYAKSELIGRKVNTLMPQVYAKYHDDFLENYLNNESAFNAKNKERFVFGKNKSNYIFPVYLNIKAVQSIIQGIQFVATFRVEKNFKSTAYVLTAPNGAIDAVSSSCINVLKMDTKFITMKKANIEDYIPNIITDRSKIFPNVNNTGKLSAIINFTYPHDSEYFTEKEEPSVQLQCTLHELLFLGGTENGGLYFKFERFVDKASQNSKLDRKAKITNFQFRIDRAKPLIIGEYVENSTDDFHQSIRVDLNGDILEAITGSDNDQSGMENTPRSPAVSKQSDHYGEEQETKRTDFGLGIKTLRLYGGKPQEPEELKSEENEEEEDDNQIHNLKKYSSRNSIDSQRQNEEDPKEGNQEESYKDFNSTFKSRKGLNSVINDKTPPSLIKNLKWVATIFNILLLVIAIVDYAIASEEFTHIQQKITLLDNSNQQISAMIDVAAKTRDLAMVNLGLSGALTINETITRNRLKLALELAQGFKDGIQRELPHFSPGHKKLLTEPVIPLVVDDKNQVEYKTLIQALEETITKAFSLSNKPVQNITQRDPDYYFVTINMLNNLYMGLVDSSFYAAVELNEHIEQNDTSFLLLLISSIIVLILTLLLIFPIFYRINKLKEEILSLFLDIPEKTIRGLYTRCETFISNLQIGDDDEIISEIDEEAQEKNEDENQVPDFMIRKKRKRFKNSGRSHKTFFLQFGIVALLLESYFIYNFASSVSLLSDVTRLATEFNSTSFAEVFYAFASNAQRHLLLNDSLPILNMNPFQVASNNIKEMYDLDSSILQQHSINRKIHSEKYTNVFNQIMMINPCTSIIVAVNVNECPTFADSTVSQGLTVAITRQFESLRALLNCYSSFKAGDNCTVEVDSTFNIASASPFQNKMYNLLLTNTSKETNKMQYVYIMAAFRSLMSSFKVSLDDKFSSELTSRLIAFILFIIALVMVYVALWVPFIIKIKNDIWRTKSMLSMIPVNVIGKIKSIRMYLKKFWNERNFSDH